jgi:Sulfotransferase family
VSLSDDYSLVDRGLHYMAFCHPAIQKALCEIENDLFGKRFEGISSDNEVFVTGMPRSGTTLLLELLYNTGEFSTYTYRHMPFILSPILWLTISGYFQKSSILKERSHGDGMQVSFDSPEAFEEVIWLAYLRDEIVKPDFLLPLTPDKCTPGFVRALRKSISKLLYLGLPAQDRDAGLRYLSKNNANLSRIDILSEVFPNAKIVVPFRRPLAHIGSLMNQHDRFLKEQSADPFTRRYMKWLGHYEFGKIIKPINYDDWLVESDVPYDTNADFWLQYWSRAYQYALDKKKDNVVFIDFDRLVETGERVLTDLADCVGLHDVQKLVGQSYKLRMPKSKEIASTECSKNIYQLACDIHEQLRIAAI